MAKVEREALLCGPLSAVSHLANKTLLFVPFYADAQNPKSFQSHNAVTSQTVFTGILLLLINFSWKQSSFRKFLVLRY